MGTLLVNEEETRKFVREFLVPFEQPRLLQLVARRKYAKNRNLRSQYYLLERSILDFGSVPPQGGRSIYSEIAQM